MKSKYLSLTLLNFLCISLCCQVPKANFHTNEHEYYDFEGKVKSCKIRNVNEQNQYHWSIMNNTNQDLHYDESGKLIKRITYNITDFLYADSIYMETKWTYNYKNNSLLEVQEIELSNNKKLNVWKYTYTGDTMTIRSFINPDKDTLSQLKTIKSDAKIYKYKRDNKEAFTLSSTQQFNSDNTIKSINTFNKDNQLNSLIIYNYTTDSSGNEILINHQVEIKKNRITKVISRKNEFGDVISKIHWDEKGGLKAETYYEYTYDHKNNWVERKSKWRADKNKEYLVHITKRDIRYF